MYHSNNGSIDEFDKEYFESILPVGKNSGKKLWTHKVIQGEHCYLIEMGIANVFILVRSSVDSQTDKSRDTGDDSIRAYVVNDKGEVLFRKNKYWTTRVKNWEDRLWEDFSNLRKQFINFHNQGIICPKCGNILPIRQNKHKQYFIKCWDCDGKDNWATYKKLSLDI